MPRSILLGASYSAKPPDLEGVNNLGRFGSESSAKRANSWQKFLREEKTFYFSPFDVVPDTALDEITRQFVQFLIVVYSVLFIVRYDCYPPTD